VGEPNFDGKYHSSRAWYTGSKDGEIETIGKKDDAAVIDPVLSASEIALLKGILKQLQGSGSGQSDFNLKQVGGTSQTGADWTINVQKLDLALTELRDALKGIDSRTISDLVTLLIALKDTDGIKKIVSALPVGDNIIGRVKLTDGTTVSAVDATTQRLKTDAILMGSLVLAHSTLSVTTNSQTALAENANRKYASFQNDSDTVIYLKVGAAAVANEGIRLNPNGGSYEMSSATGNLDTRAVYAIHAGTGNKTLLVAEGV